MGHSIIGHQKKSHSDWLTSLQACSSAELYTQLNHSQLVNCKLTNCKFQERDNECQLLLLSYHSNNTFTTFMCS